MAVDGVSADVVLLGNSRRAGPTYELDLDLLAFGVVADRTLVLMPPWADGLLGILSAAMTPAKA